MASQGNPQLRRAFDGTPETLIGVQPRVRKSEAMLWRELHSFSESDRLYVNYKVFHAPRITATLPNIHKKRTLGLSIPIKANDEGYQNTLKKIDRIHHQYVTDAEANQIVDHEKRYKVNELETVITVLNMMLGILHVIRPHIDPPNLFTEGADDVNKLILGICQYFLVSNFLGIFGPEDSPLRNRDSRLSTPALAPTNRSKDPNFNPESCGRAYVCW